MKLFKKSTMALAMVVASAFTFSTAHANTQATQTQPSAAQKTAAQPSLKIHADTKQNLAEIQRAYPILKIESLETAQELKSVKFNFEELLKAAEFTNANYGKAAKYPDFQFIQIPANADKKIKAKFEKLSGAEQQKYGRTINQALMQAPVLAYYEYLTTGQVPTQKDVYSLVEYQNKRYAQVRLTDLPVALTGKREDALLNLLLTRISIPFDQSALLGWYNQATKMNTQPMSATKPISYGALFAQARTNVAQAQIAKAQQSQLQQGKAKSDAAAKKQTSSESKQKS